MEYDLKEIKEIRKKFNLTQSDLAKKSGVSQSLIAKIEAGRLDPTYTNAKKIFNALDELSKKVETKVEEIMISKPISVSPESPITDVVKRMRTYEISQVLVIDNNKLLGYVSESDILDAFTKGKKGAKVKEIMEDSPPTITKAASMTVVSDLLKFYPIVAVAEQGKIIGIVTKSDILRKAYKQGMF